MQTREWHFTDKSTWGDGPWQSEPDKKQWTDPATGLPCLIRRAGRELGHLCGYVGVPEGHPFFGIDYSGCPVGCGESWCEHTPEDRLEVHGGITFSSFCSEDHEHGICHTPDPGEPDRVWWLGFDCAHSGDLSPGTRGRLRQLGFADDLDDIYRDLAYVEAECARLAKQLSEIAVGP